MADCMGDYGEVIVFGDDDEGKILDLQGGLKHYQYVLGLFSCMLDKQYTKLHGLKCENLNWLFTNDEYSRALHKPLYYPPVSACYKEGGNTILRSQDHRILIGIDHAALGFGRIAAHGHADALSFQMFVDGQPVFVDPGTYIYHCDQESRNAFRKTENHSTVCVDGKDQSEMLGAFLWGKRAECELLAFEDNENYVVVKARHNGYGALIHSRSFRFDKACKLEITDILSNQSKGVAFFVVAPEFQIEKLEEKRLMIVCGTQKILMSFEGYDITIDYRNIDYSDTYGLISKTKKISVQFTERVQTKIWVWGE
jgi:uncharacterized heparinase superfamily protein